MDGLRKTSGQYGSEEQLCGGPGPPVTGGQLW